MYLAVHASATLLLPCNAAATLSFGKVPATHMVQRCSGMLSWTACNMCYGLLERCSTDGTGATSATSCDIPSGNRGACCAPKLADANLLTVCCSRSRATSG